MIEAKEMDKRHGGAYDRGRADSYYNRGHKPHMFAGATYASPQVTQKDMTPEQVAEYSAGYRWNEEFGTRRTGGDRTPASQGNRCTDLRSQSGSTSLTSIASLIGSSRARVPSFRERPYIEQCPGRPV